MSTSGPQRPLVDASDAALHFHQTCRSGGAQHFRGASDRHAGRSALSLRVRQGPVLVLRDGGSYISLGDGILRATRIFHYVDHKVGFPALWLGNDFRFSADTQLAPPL